MRLQGKIAKFQLKKHVTPTANKKKQTPSFRDREAPKPDERDALDHDVHKSLVDLQRGGVASMWRKLLDLANQVSIGTFLRHDER